MPALDKHASCFACQSRDRSEWCVLVDDEIAHLNRAKICNVYEPGQVIFYEDNPCMGIHCIESGTVALRKQAAGGSEMITRLFHEGDTLGYLAYFADRGYTGTAMALTRCRICFIERTSVRTLIEANPAVGLQFLQRTAENLRESEESRLQAATLPLRVRLAHLLLVFKDRFGTVEDDGTIRVGLPLSRQDMAAMLGARPESLSRTIKALEEAGTARFERREVLLPDLDLLLDEFEAAG